MEAISLSLSRKGFGRVIIELGAELAHGGIAARFYVLQRRLDHSAGLGIVGRALGHRLPALEVLNGHGGVPW